MPKPTTPSTLPTQPPVTHRPAPAAPASTAHSRAVQQRIERSEAQPVKHAPTDPHRPAA